MKIKIDNNNINSDKADLSEHLHSNSNASISPIMYRYNVLYGQNQFKSK